MGDITEVTGMVLSAMPVGEFDRRVVLLTRERGKISAFAKGARRPNSPLTGVTRAFVFGTFQMYEGRTSYTIRQANITNYFEDIITDLDAVCYACYFAELADYYGRENLDASVMINLLYAALRALAKPKPGNELVRYVYELRLISANGESPDFFTCQGCNEEKSSFYSFSKRTLGVYCEDCRRFASDAVVLNPSTVYTLQYIVTSPIEKLFSFIVNDEVLRQLSEVAGAIRRNAVDKTMKSLQMLELQEEINVSE